MHMRSDVYTHEISKSRENHRCEQKEKEKKSKS